MAVVIHRAPQLTKCLQKLLKAGGRSALAAQRAEAVLAQLACHDGLQPEQLPKLTNFGERRIEGCKKFNLGGGYRLVYIQEGNQYVFLFVGTHDDCDRWLTNNKNFKMAMPNANTSCMMPETPVDQSTSSAQDTPGDEIDYDVILMQNIDEKMLRRVFRGLFK